MSALPITRRELLLLIGAAGGSRIVPSLASETVGVAPQPYFAQVKRALAAMAELGAPIAAADVERIQSFARQADHAAVLATEAVLDPYTLARLAVDPDGTVHVAHGGARRTLVEQGWRMFLVRVSNAAARSDQLNFSTGWFYAPTPAQLMPGTGTFRLTQGTFLLDTLDNAALIEKLWLQAGLHGASPAVMYGLEVPVVELSGSALDYRVLQLYSRDHGKRSAALSLTVFPAPGVAGDSASQVFDFDCLPSRVVTLGVRDTDGRGCVASLTIKDGHGHVYPPLAMRLAPDMYFQEQIYRADGETMRLPDGEYVVTGTRGPEYLRSVQTQLVDAAHDRIDINLVRWIDPSNWGWYSGDPHIHAGGCLHYQVPTEGVTPETMIRHVRGEGLWIGDVLSWGPSWYYQKQFFSGVAASPEARLEHPELQAANNATLQPRSTPTDTESTLRYDVEVSGFPSSHAGHLILLRLEEQDYPGTTKIEDWPSWNLPIIQWARAQGALAGYAHCGLGMAVDSTELPNYDIPPMNGIGTQEAIVDVTHGLVDFLAGCDTSPVAELNAWYHLLNCGFRLAFVGETDYPCLSGERVGVGRSYVRLDEPPIGDAGYSRWIQGLQRGRLYCGDGRSHFLEFTVDGRASGDEDVSIARPGSVRIEAIVAARLEPEITPETEAWRTNATGDWIWGWHIEKARIAQTRNVPVELVVNGHAVARVEILADGTPRPVRFETSLVHSSWVAMRVMPSGHTHPVFVAVDRKPIRASRRSAQWCRACVDKIWEVKSRFIRESERPAAAAAFDHARRTYEGIVREALAE